MKYIFLTVSLFFCSITIAMEQKQKRAIVTDFKAHHDGNRIVASGKVNGKMYSVEKDLIGNTFAVSRMVPVKDVHTEGVEFYQVNNKPNVTAAFKRKINDFQKHPNKHQPKKSAPLEQSKNAASQENKGVLRKKSSRFLNSITSTF